MNTCQDICPQINSLRSRDWPFDEMFVDAANKVCAKCLTGFTNRLEDIGRNKDLDRDDCQDAVKAEVKRFAAANKY